jgi:hypothetical protein
MPKNIEKRLSGCLDKMAFYWNNQKNTTTFALQFWLKT